MSVFVDNMNAPYGRMVMCHMAADSTAELLEMADKIGVKRKWLQHQGSWKEHFDICLAKKKLAIQFGAEEVTMYELVKRQRLKAAIPKAIENLKAEAEKEPRP